MLNGLALLRHRIDGGAGDTLDIMDAVSGYYSTGVYIDQRRARVSLERFHDWFECLAALQGFASSAGRHWAVEPFDDEARVTLELSPLAEVVQLIFDTTPPGQQRTIGWRRGPSPHRLDLCVRPDSRSLREALDRLGTASATWHDDAEDAAWASFELEPG